MPQTRSVKGLGSEFFMSSFIKFFIKEAPIFKFWVIFDKFMNVYFQKVAKKLSKKFFLVAFEICKFPLSLVLKNSFFGALKFKNHRNCLATFLR